MRSKININQSRDVFWGSKGRMRPKTFTYSKYMFSNITKPCLYHWVLQNTPESWNVAQQWWHKLYIYNIYLFIYLFVYSFIHLFIYWFIYIYIHIDCCHLFGAFRISPYFCVPVQEWAHEPRLPFFNGILQMAERTGGFLDDPSVWSRREHPGLSPWLISGDFGLISHRVGAFRGDLVTACGIFKGIGWRFRGDLMVT